MNRSDTFAGLDRVFGPGWYSFRIDGATITVVKEDGTEIGPFACIASVARLLTWLVTLCSELYKATEGQFADADFDGVPAHKAEALCRKLIRGGREAARTLSRARTLVSEEGR